MINTPKHLAWILKVDLKEINSIILNIDKYYREKKLIKTDKFGKPKLDNEGNPRVRIINPSINRLKVIQKRIQRNILLDLEMPEYCFGAVKGKDNIQNAKKHQGKRYKFTTDLKDFFPSITNTQVFEMFGKNGFSPTISRILTKLTTYKGKIPQGAPTSSTIANLVFIKTGNDLEFFSKKNNIIFSSFVDDLTFSSAKDFKDKTEEILDLIIKGGFKISHKKTYYSRNPIITGLLSMNNHLKLPKSFIEKLENKEYKSLEQINGLLRYRNRVNEINYCNKRQETQPDFNGK